ncbi:MAG: type I restriction-modification enzyme R subunit C-terminal domain-containing protein [Cyanobacteriota bacterium]
MADPASGSEAEARLRIDALLEASGWAVQDRSAIQLSAGLGVAVRELPTAGGEADYGLFLGHELVGVVEAKKVGTPLGGVEAQTLAYATETLTGLQVPVQPRPFRYESTGVETFFTNGLDPDPTARRVFSFHRPETLGDWLRAEVMRRAGRPDAPPAPTLKGRMRLAAEHNRAGLWPAQIRAVENLEASICLGRLRALLQMATGGGKTITAISGAYRLISQGGARRVLFLVDRGNLGRQALKEFQGYTTPDDGRKFSELYNVVNLSNNRIDPVNKVVITTIQRLYSILKGEPSFDADLEEESAFDGHGADLVRGPQPVVYNAQIPPDFFDVIVVDECHRSIYSLWSQVLEYFDATIIGLTATPGGHTYAWFHRNVVSEYRHEEAVRDKVNVPFWVYQIRTQVGDQGATVEAGPGLGVIKRNRLTREERWEALEEDLSYAKDALDRSVVVPDQIRTVLRTIRQKLFTELFPGRKEIPKLLFFAKNDSHAEDILRILRDEWCLSNEQAVKITYKAEQDEAGRVAPSRRPDQLIKDFANSYNPRVAVTVDMIATGTDIKPLEGVVFLRMVRSQALFEQMKGRAVRVMADADFQAISPDGGSKTQFVVIDCEGVMEGVKADPPLDRTPSVPFKTILELVRMGNRDEEVLSTLASRLDQMDRRLTPEQHNHLAAVPGAPQLRELVAHLLDRLDPDQEVERARELFAVPEAVAPTEEQRREARKQLLDEAAHPLVGNPAFCEALVTVRQAQEITVDVLTCDSVTFAGARPDQNLDYASPAAGLTSAFEAYCRENRDQLEALSVLYAKPYRQRITRAKLVELAEAIQRPPRQWTTEALWHAYEQVEANRVKGASTGKHLTDLISLARHALGVEEELVSFQDQASERFAGWLAQQANRGRTFSEEQLRWLELIRDQIVVDLEVRMEDLDEPPFAQQGGLGKVYALFGVELGAIVAELNEVVAA